MPRTLLLLACCAAFATIALGEQEAGQSTGYGLMMDAGSTGSRVHVYRWINSDEPGALPEFTDDFFLEVKPGISSYKDEPEKAGASLKPLIDYALTKVPKELQATTSVYLMASAGLRLLPEEKQGPLLDSVRDYLATTPFIFKREWVSIISGTEEAVGAWITVNYLLKKLSPGSETAGIIDLGGGSVQIAAAPTKKPAAEALTQVNIMGRKYQLYIYSHLGYGLMQARKGIAKASGSSNPCLPTGFEFEGTQGSGDSMACQAVVKKFMAEGGREKPFLDIPRANHFGEYLGFSYIYDVLPSLGLPESPSVEEIDAVLGKICSMDQTELEKTYADSGAQDGFIPFMCSDAAYIRALMTEGLQLEPAEKRMKLGKQIDGKEISWTLGAMIARLQAPGSGERKVEIPRYSGIVLGVIVAAAAAFYRYKTKPPPARGRHRAHRRHK